VPDGGVRVTVRELGTDGHLHETPVAPALQLVSVPVVVDLPRPWLLARAVRWIKRWWLCA
jgi:hypothetical protein